MKKTICILAVFLIPFSGIAQDDAISKFLGKYVNDEKFSTVYITKRMFRLIAQITDDEESKEFEKTINNIESFCILSSDQVKGRQLYKEVINTIPIKQYEELMIIREGQDLTKFLIRENSKGQILELLMISGKEKDFTILSMTGIIDLESIAKLSKQMEIDGLEHLEKSNKKN